MTKRSKEEIEQLIKLAENHRNNAPTLAPEDAQRLFKKWSLDSKSMTANMLTSPKDEES